MAAGATCKHAEICQIIGRRPSQAYGNQFDVFLFCLSNWTKAPVMTERRVTRHTKV